MIFSIISHIHANVKRIWFYPLFRIKKFALAVWKNLLDTANFLCYNEYSHSKIVEKCPKVWRNRAFFETYRQISHLIGKTLEKAPKLLYNENRLRKPLVRCRFFACESEVIYVKHYRNQKHYKGI